MAELTSEVIPLELSTCQACTKCSRPQKLNEVIVAHCYNYYKLLGEIPEYLEQLVEGIPNTGPGDNLKWCLSWWVSQPVNCKCDDRAEIMNAWGKEKCLQEINTIASWLRESALDQNVYYNDMLVRWIIKRSCR